MIKLEPIGLRAANAFVDEVHRHHSAATGHKFSIGAVDGDGKLCGVVIAGRPVARQLDNGRRLEVLRLATDGTKNACSMLYSAVARAAVAMGYDRGDVFTYILASETGDSLRAAGWVEVATSPGGTWDRGSRRRTDRHPTEPKRRWHASEPAQHRQAA